MLYEIISLYLRKMRVGFVLSYTHPTRILHAKNGMYCTANQIFIKISVGCRIKHRKTIVCVTTKCAFPHTVIATLTCFFQRSIQINAKRLCYSRSVSRISFIAIAHMTLFDEQFGITHGTSCIFKQKLLLFHRHKTE